MGYDQFGNGFCKSQYQKDSSEDFIGASAIFMRAFIPLFCSREGSVFSLVLGVVSNRMNAQLCPDAMALQSGAAQCGSAGLFSLTPCCPSALV